MERIAELNLDDLIDAWTFVNTIWALVSARTEHLVNYESEIYSALNHLSERQVEILGKLISQIGDFEASFTDHMLHRLGICSELLQLDKSSSRFESFTSEYSRKIP